MNKTPQQPENRQTPPGEGTKPSASEPQRSGGPEPKHPADRGDAANDPGTLDAIDEAEYESFPASDPPSYTGSSCTPSVPKKK